MIVAGIGFRTGAIGVEIVAAVDAALAVHGARREQIARLATSREKCGEIGAVEAGRLLGLAVAGVDRAELERFSDATLTHSERSMATTGVPSLSEAVALAAAGDGANLLGPRVAVGTATCALAEIKG